MKTSVALVLSALSVASAFAPAANKASTSAMDAAIPRETILSEPDTTEFGGIWDPLGLAEMGSDETIAWYRHSEIKHGRVSMLAVVGYLVTAAGVRFPGAEGIPDGLGSWQALLDTKDGMNVLMQMGAFFVVAEICNRDAYWLDKEPAEFVGDYRNGALDFGWDKLSAASKMNKRSIELNNGRAAMMGIWGLVTHEIMGVSILPGGYLPGH